MDPSTVNSQSAHTKVAKPHIPPTNSGWKHFIYYMCVLIVNLVFGTYPIYLLWLVLLNYPPKNDAQGFGTFFSLIFAIPLLFMLGVIDLVFLVMYIKLFASSEFKMKINSYFKDMLFGPPTK